MSIPCVVEYICQQSKPLHAQLQLRACCVAISTLSAGSSTGIGLACIFGAALVICALMYYLKKRDDRWAAAHPPPPPAVGMVTCHAHTVSSSQTADQHWAQLQLQPVAPTARPAYVTAPAPGRITQVLSS